MTNHPLKKTSSLRKMAKSEIRDKYKITAVLFLMMLTFGMINNFDGPVLIDFGAIFNVPIEKLGALYIFGGVGYLIGSMSGFLYTFVNRQMTLIITQLISSIAISFYSLAPNLGSLFGQYLVQGIGSGAFDLINSVWLIELWQDQCQPVLYLAEMLAGVGMIIVPQIEKPFLTGFQENVTDHKSNQTTANHLVTVEERRANLLIPFLILGCTMFIGGILMLILFIRRKYEPPSVEVLLKNPDDSPKIFEDNEKWRVSMVILMSLTLAFYEVVEEAYHSWVPTYIQLLPLRISAKEAADIKSAEAISYTVGRAISFLISRSGKVRPETVLTFHFALIIISLLSLQFFASETELLLWVFNILIGYGFSAIWPALFAHSEQYLVITDKVASIILSVTCLFWTVVPYLVGKVIEANPKALIHYGLAFMFLSVATFIAMRVGVCIKRKINWNKKMENKQMDNKKTDKCCEQYTNPSFQSDS